MENTETNHAESEKAKRRFKLYAGFVFNVIGVIAGVCTVFGGEHEKLIEISKRIFVCAFIVGIVLWVLFFLDWYQEKKGIVKNFFGNVQKIANYIESNDLSEKIAALSTGVCNLSEKVANTNSAVTQQMAELKKNTEIMSGNCQTRCNSLQNSQDEVLKKINADSNFKYHDAHVNGVLVSMLDSRRDIKKIRIICFGRKGYGEVVSHIFDNNLDIEIEVIVCKPDIEGFPYRDDDKVAILRLIKEMLPHNAKVYASAIPPAIRAATLYAVDGPSDKLTAIWTATQSYQFGLGQNMGLELEKPKASLIVTCDADSSAGDLNGVVSCFDKEFTRLKQNSFIPHLDGNGEIYFEKYAEDDS